MAVETRNVLHTLYPELETNPYNELRYFIVYAVCLCYNI